MKERRSVTPILILTVGMCLLATGRAFSGIGDDSKFGAIMRSVAQPKLLYPNDITVSISANERVRFQWALSAGPLVQIDYIEFSLYKGRDLTEQNLIFKKQLSRLDYTIKAPPHIFEDNQVYSWRIRQVFLRGDKSNEQSAMFKILKRIK